MTKARGTISHQRRKYVSNASPKTLLTVMLTRRTDGHFASRRGTPQPAPVYRFVRVERTAMRRQLIAAAALVGALALPASAAAKGPESASLTGPGLDRSLAIHGQGESGAGTPLGALVTYGGYFSQVFGENPDPTIAARPKGTLGPRYKVVYFVPGPNGDSRITQFVYPYAKPVPLTYMNPGQRFWKTERTHGGWFKSYAALTRALKQVGLPARR